LFTLTLTLISSKWAIVWLFVANGDLHDISKDVYQGWEFFYIAWLIYLFGFIILLMVINATNN